LRQEAERVSLDTFRKPRGRKEKDMKLVLQLLVLLILISLSACNTVADIVGPDCNIKVVADSHEPNDKPEEATPLNTLELTGTFKELDAPDYFTVNGKTGEVIMLEKKFGIGEPTLKVTNTENESLTVTQQAPTQSVTIPEDGTYLIQIGLQTTGNQCPDDVEYDLSLLASN
jgi:predicted small secreted protein